MAVSNFSSYASLVMEDARKLVERYVLGTEVNTISDIEPTAGQVEGGGPAEYASFPYPLGSETWPTNYPVGVPEAEDFPSEAPLGTFPEKITEEAMPLPLLVAPPFHDRTRSRSRQQNQRSSRLGNAFLCIQ